MRRLFQISIALVILGHLVFAGMQAFAWGVVADRLLGISDPAAVIKTAAVGTSFASYNFSIAVGLTLSFFLTINVQSKVHLTVLALIVFTAIVGYFGTGSLVILVARLLPAVVALLSLLVLTRKAQLPIS
ncbi:DUF1304 family protein [Leisingera aquaemixtae]|uniref:DUF1304 family protein n=1 Tax=Leisingera aquaemixtae TaxID=1396826 RepID=UPI001C93F446|nr:DUF1304 family protein [Leisingera aquaemixtae]MBY6068813.1 DUF1304 family protein [Leisingera aquaemixtae]